MEGVKGVGGGVRVSTVETSQGKCYCFSLMFTVTPDLVVQVINQMHLWPHRGQVWADAGYFSLFIFLWIKCGRNHLARAVTIENIGERGKVFRAGSVSVKRGSFHLTTNSQGNGTCSDVSAEDRPKYKKTYGVMQNVRDLT